jgi:hypothetical protein
MNPDPDQPPEIDPRRPDPDKTPRIPPVRMPMVEVGGSQMDVISRYTLTMDALVCSCALISCKWRTLCCVDCSKTASFSWDRRWTMMWPTFSWHSCSVWRTKTHRLTSLCTLTGVGACASCECPDCTYSPGGSVSAGMAIFDAMQFVPCDVSTVCFGLAASMGAFLLGAGTKVHKAGGSALCTSCASIGETEVSSERTHHDTPAARWSAGAGGGHRDPGAVLKPLPPTV